MKKLVSLVFLFLLLSTSPIVSLGLSSLPQTVSRIIILPNGNIDPADVPIHRNGNMYTLTDSIFAQIIVDKDNIIIDGAGYVLQGTYNGTRTDSWVVGQGSDQEFDEMAIPWTIGVDLANENRYGLTIRNLNIKNFYIGVYLWTSNNTITGCAVSDNIVGILLSGDCNSIISNYISNNEQGIFFGVNTEDVPENIILNHNSFVDNLEHFSGCVCEDYNTTEPMHTWDNGEEGNYWSDYDGTDDDGDGIGDTPYIIDVQNQDRYPLTQLAAVPPTAPLNLPFEIIAITVALPTIIIIATLIAYSRKKR